MTQVCILYVDDDVLAQWTLTDALQGAGFTVTSVCRAADALQLLQSADFDILLTEVALPDCVSGVELADSWRRAYPKRPVVYLTYLPRAVVGSLEEGEAFIQKPCRGDDLLEIINEVLDETVLHVFDKPNRRSALVH